MSPFPDLPAEQLVSFLSLLRGERETEEPYLIFADWLEDHGDPRAELIRLQLERSRCRYLGRCWHEVTQWEEGWLQRYRGVWPGRLPEGWKVHFDRGLAALTLSARHFFEPWPEWLAQATTQGWLRHLSVAVLTNKEVRALVEIDTSTPESPALTGPRLEWITGLNLRHKVTKVGLTLLQNLPSVSSLDLGGSRITETGLKAIRRMTALKTLCLPPHLGDAGLEHLEDLNNLEVLYLSGTQITDAGLFSLRQLTRLERLDLRRTRLTGTGLQHLRGLTRLRELSMWATEVSGPGLVHLQALPKLQTLTLSNTQVNDEDMRLLSAVASLKKLDLAYTEVTDAGLAELSKLPHLEHLNLQHVALTDDGLRSLSQVSSLRELCLYQTRITDAGLAQLRSLSQLEWLDVRQTQATRQGVLRLPAAIEVEFEEVSREDADELSLDEAPQNPLKFLPFLWDDDQEFELLLDDEAPEIPVD